MLRRWKVGYYEYNLTEWKERLFFTELATILYCFYLRLNKIKYYTYCREIGL